MTYLALSETTGDMILPNGGGVSRVSEGRFVVQQVRSKLRTFLGEWALDASVGWLTYTDFEKNWQEFRIEDRARRIILGTDGVTSIDSLTSTYFDRKLEITFTARTIYGTINLTVPWE